MDENQGSFFMVIIVVLVIMLVGVLTFATIQINYFTNRISYIENVLNRYIYNEYYYPESPLERIDAIVLNTTEVHDNLLTEHYKGVDSFYYDPISVGISGSIPIGWTLEQGLQRNVKILQNRWNHEKTLQMYSSRFDTNPIIRRDFGSASSGTIEYWYAHGYPGIDIFLDQDFTRILASNGSTIAEWGDQYKQFSWYNNSVFVSANQTGTYMWNWWNVKMEFRCGGAPIYAGLPENTFNLYYNYTLLVANASFNIPTTSIQYLEIEQGNAYSNWDALSWTWGNLDVTGDPYQLGDKDTTWETLSKTVEIYYYFPKNFLNIKNFTYWLNFTVNRTLDSDIGSEYGLFSYEDSSFYGFTPVTTNFTIPTTSINRSAIRWTNPTSTKITHIRQRIYMSNVHKDWEFTVSADCFAYFWLP